ncbi:gephyrin-like molybdotransferase receptor GlpR [Nocardia sp. XZ_19_385]|uniref:divisome protein SepX/GlpR n=1 Tax=Nocardia sp. XZ_19_385 TaxID=2769488 RepID=UPI00188FBBC5|nr:gephyrin-like molybdotransferase receptor GlpR [Nocardia sp. XZ_19_385]
MPNSILWIGLVVLWVFVLFPILADRHPRIRQTTDAALATRVLHRGGSKRRMKSGPAAGHDSDPDYRPSRAHRKFFPSDDAEHRMNPAEEVTDPEDELTGATPELEAGPSAACEPDSAPVELADDETLEAELAEEIEEAEYVDEDAEFDGADTVTAGSAADSADSADDDDVGERSEPETVAMPPARIEDFDSEYDEFDAADPDFVPSRRGRGGFDPEADAIARAARYTFRQRAVLGLLLGAIACGALGIVFTALFWWLSGLCAIVLATYLGYLRKQVRIEEDIRRRRAARLTRAQQRGEGPVEDTRQAEARAHRHTIDRETARALRRRSTLLETDDEDPMFEHLETFDPATARALRERHGAGDYRRAAGE